MSSAAASEAVVAPPAMAESPPIMLVFPVLRAVLSASFSLFRFGFRSILTLAAPFHLIWPVAYAILSPAIIMVEIALNVFLFSPISLLYRVMVALYPVYVFCAVACLTGAAVGVLGRYIVATIMDYLAQTEFFSPPMDSLRAPSSNQQPVLRKRKRKSVRIQ